jgi:hypothetical protein
MEGFYEALFPWRSQNYVAVSSGFFPVFSNESFVRIVYVLLATAAYGFVCDHNYQFHITCTFTSFFFLRRFEIK